MRSDGCTITPVRIAATIASEFDGEVPQAGEVFLLDVFIAHSISWAHIRLDDGRQGFVKSSYCSAVGKRRASLESLLGRALP